MSMFPEEFKDDGETLKDLPDFKPYVIIKDNLYFVSYTYKNGFYIDYKKNQGYDKKEI